MGLPIDLDKKVCINNVELSSAPLNITGIFTPVVKVRILFQSEKMT